MDQAGKADNNKQQLTMRIVLIVDSDGHQQAIGRVLGESDLPFELVQLPHSEKALAQLSSLTGDLVLVDMQPPQQAGTEIYRQMLTQDKGLPFVFLGAAGCETFAAEAFELGAQDYLFKDPDRRYLTLLPALLKKAYRQWQRQQAEAELQVIESRWRILGANAPAQMTELDRDGMILFLNRTKTERTVESFIGRRMFDFIPPQEQGKLRNVLKIVFETGEKAWYESTLTDPDGTKTYYEHHVAPFFREGEVISAIHISTDATERKRTEQALYESEEKYRLLVENAVEAITVTDSNGVFAVINAKAAELLGGQPDDFIGKTLWDVLPKEHADLSMASIKNVVDTGAGHQVETPVMVQGALRWFHSSSQPVRNHAGEVAAVLSFSYDITKRKQAEAKVRYQANLLENISDAIVAADVDFKITGWNKAAEVLYGWRADEVMGKPFAEVVRPDYSPGSREDAIAAFSALNYWEGEVIHRRKDSALLNVYSKVSSINDHDGQLAGGVAVNRDITERKKAKERRLELLREKERRAILSHFLTNVSHEFRTPLTTISTSTYLAEKSIGDEGQRRYFQQIKRQVGNLTRLVGNLTTMSRLEGGRSNLDWGTVDINDVIHTLNDALKLVHQKKQLRVSLELPPHSVYVQGDFDYLTQAFHHIWNNAIRHVPHEGEIRISVQQKGDAVIIDMFNNGPGISDDVRSHIFERFFRIDSAGTTRGFGLGLPIAKAIIELHQGHIDVESHSQPGAVFRITLPLSEIPPLGAPNQQ
jgi:PAS domain S-box-containing protein